MKLEKLGMAKDITHNSFNQEHVQDKYRDNLSDRRFDFLVECGFATHLINEHTDRWNESVLKYASDEQLIELFIPNLKYVLQKTENQNLSLYLFFLYTDAFLTQGEGINTSLHDYIERTFSRIFNMETDGVIAIFGKGKKIILKEIQSDIK